MQRRFLRKLKKITSRWACAAFMALPVIASAAGLCSFVPTTLNGVPTPVASGDGDLSIGNNSTLSTTSTACATPNGSTCTDASGTGTTLQTGLGVQPPAQTLGAFQPTTFPSVGGSNVTVNNSSLAAGSWGKVSLSITATFSGGNYYISEVNPGNSVTLNLAAGDYFVDKWTGGNNFVINVTSGPVRVFIKTSFQAGNGSIFNAGGSPANFQIYLYDNATASFGNSDNGNTNVSFSGLIYAPGSNTNISFGNNNVIKGAVLSGGNISLGNNTGVVYDTATQAAIASINLCNLSLNLRMDETSWASGGSIADSSGNGLHGTLSGSASGVAAKVCNGGNLSSASSNVITVANSSRLDLSTGGTISFWVKPTDNSLRWLFGKGTDYYAYLDAGGKLIFGWGSLVILPITKLQSASTVPTNAWTHVALRLDDAAGKIFLHLNGNTTPDATATTAINITNSSSALTVGNGFWPSGFIYNGVIDEFKIFRSTAFSAADVASIYTNELAGRNFEDGATRSCPGAGPNHVELVHDGAGINCAPEAVSVIACTGSASCNGDSASQYSGSFTIDSLPTPAGGQWCTNSTCTATATFPMTFSNNSTQLFLREPAVRTDRLAGTASPAATSTLQCKNTGSGAFNSTTACDLAFTSSGFVVTLPDHLSCTATTMTIQALQSGAPGTACTPAFVGARNVSMAFTYTNPASGTRQPAVAGTTLTTAGANVPLTFNASGVATASYIYDDVGKLGIALSYTGAAATGDAGLTLGGSVSQASARTDASTDGVISAPASFVVTPSIIAPDTRYFAGRPFNVALTARNACASPTATANFGKEGATMNLTCSRSQPAGANDCVNGPCDGVFTGCTVGSAGNGSFTGTPTWSEFGVAALTASLGGGSYLGYTPAAAPTGSGTTGTIEPHHFDTTVSAACGSSFSYAGVVSPAQAGQPFTVTATAKNAIGGTTLNYDSARAGGLVSSASVSVVSPAVTVGSLAATSIASFAKGAGNSATSTYSFVNRATGPTSVTLHSDSVATTGNTGYSDAVTELRSGRIRLFNANGSDLLDLPLTLRVEYWAGAASAWQLNTADTCSSVAAANFALVFPVAANNKLAACETAVSVSGSAPNQSVVLRRPGSGNEGWTDVELNLDSAASGSTCTTVGAAASTATTANLPWLRYNWTGTLGNPKARATFGVYRSGPVLHRREMF